MFNPETRGERQRVVSVPRGSLLEVIVGDDSILVEFIERGKTVPASQLPAEKKDPLQDVMVSFMTGEPLPVPKPRIQQSSDLYLG